MDIQIILIAIVILVMAWALERIVAKTQNLEKHIAGIRTRINNLEKRLTAASQTVSPTNPSYYSRPQQPAQQPQRASSSAGRSSISRTHRRTSASASSKNAVVCPFCGTEFDAELDKCPKCHHINIEKYKIKSKSSSADDIDI